MLRRGSLLYVDKDWGEDFECKPIPCKYGCQDFRVRLVLRVEDAPDWPSPFPTPSPRGVVPCSYPDVGRLSQIPLRNCTGSLSAFQLIRSVHHDGRPRTR